MERPLFYFSNHSSRYILSVLLPWKGLLLIVYTYSHSHRNRLQTYSLWLIITIQHTLKSIKISLFLLKISETKKTSLRIIFMKKNIFLREHNSFFSWKKIFSLMKRIWITWINNIKGHHKYARNLLWLRDEKTTYSLWIYHDYAYICTWRQLLLT